MSGPFKMKGFPAHAGVSPAKHTEEESGFSHQHPHTKKQEKLASSRKKVDKFWVEKGNASTVVPDEMEGLQEMGTEFEKSTRKRWGEES